MSISLPKTGPSTTIHLAALLAAVVVLFGKKIAQTTVALLRK